MTAPGRWLVAPVKALGGLLVLSLWAAPCAAEADVAPAPIAVTVVAEPPCAPRLRDLVAEQLADVASALSWSCNPRLELEGLTPAAAGLRIWIDLSMAGEVRLTLGDARGERFVLRKVPLATGLDEIGREEVAHILRSATLALLSGQSETLTRAQAEATLSTWSPPPSRDARRLTPQAVSTESPSAPGRPAPAGRPAVELGPTWSLQALSRQIPLVQEIALSLSFARADGPLVFWTEAGYRLPATYDTDPVGVSLDALSLRLGPALRARAARDGSLAFVFAVGVGLEWNGFTPRAGSGGGAAFAPTPESRFAAFSGRASISVAYRPTAYLGVAFRLFCDVAAADVHYDYRDTAGVTHRLVSAFPVSPGAGLSIVWRS